MATNISIVIKKHSRARSLKMHVDIIQKVVVLTVPQKCRPKIIDAFINKSQTWLAAQQHKLMTPSLPLTLILNNQQFFIDYHPLDSNRAKAGVKLMGPDIHVYGGRDDYKKHLIQYLKTVALEQASLYVNNYAQQLDVNINKVGVKEYKSRWGCCYKRGDIFLSWRLIMAPPEIFQYVCAHEVAHLSHQNHSPQYWQVVDSIYSEHQTARRWLRNHGHNLFTII